MTNTSTEDNEARNEAGNNNALSEFNDLFKKILNSDVWVRLGSALSKIYDIFIKIISKETDVKKRTEFQGFFNDFKSNLDLVANHAEIMLPRLTSNKKQFEILDKLLNSNETIAQNKLEEYIFNVLKVLNENLNSIQELDKHLQNSAKIHQKVAELQLQVAEQLSKTSNILSWKSIQYKKTTSGIAALIGAFGGAGTVGTLIGIEALGGCGKLALGTLVLACPLHLGLAVLAGMAISAALIGLITYGVLTYIKKSNTEKFHDLDDLNQDIDSLLLQSNELKDLLEETYKHKQNLTFHVDKVKDILMDEFQRDVNKDICNNLTKDNEELTKAYEQIILLRSSLNMQNFFN